MSLYILQHKETGKYITSVIAKIDPRTMKHKGKLTFKMHEDINQARIIENPDMDAIKKYGLIAVGIIIQNNKVTPLFKVYEHVD